MPTRRTLCIRMRCAIYTRTSEDDPDCETQLAELRYFCESQGWEPVEYVEDKIGRYGQKRPVLRKLMADARRKRFFRVIAVWDLDSFGSSLRGLIEEIDNLVLPFRQASRRHRSNLSATGPLSRGGAALVLPQCAAPLTSKASASAARRTSSCRNSPSRSTRRATSPVHPV